MHQAYCSAAHSNQRTLLVLNGDSWLGKLQFAVEWELSKLQYGEKQLYPPVLLKHLPLGQVAYRLQKKTSFNALSHARWLRCDKEKSELSSDPVTIHIPVRLRKSGLDRWTNKVTPKTMHRQELAQSSPYHLPFEQAQSKPEAIIWSLDEDSFSWAGQKETGQSNTRSVLFL